MDDKIAAAVESLQGFVSDSIYQWLTTDTDLPAPPPSVDPPTSSSSTQLNAADKEFDLDELFRACSDSFEDLLPNKRLKLGEANGKQCYTYKQRKFALPKTEEEIEQARIGAIPKKTKSDTKYCVGMWDEWRYHRLVNFQENIPQIADTPKPALSKLLSQFVLEIRKKNGDKFPPNTLHHIVCGLQRYLRLNGHTELDFFKNPEFAVFKADLDAEMKCLQGLGIGSKRRQAEPLTVEEEELLWQKGLLGSNSPQTLLDTILFMNGMYFALRSGSEHRQLRNDPCQIELVEREGERSYLRYTEYVSKNKPGGLKGRKTKPKIVLHHANEHNPERCFVKLFKMYNRLCPSDRPKDVFYLQPLKKTSPDCWFSTKPVGYNKLDATVARLCKSAGIIGYRTNHSLRATTATRLYQAGVDEQLVMERTGHQSLDGVRSYKRTSTVQQESLSNILNGTKYQLSAPVTKPDLPLVPRDNTTDQNTTDTITSGGVVQVNNTIAHTSLQPPPAFNFYSCSVTINNYVTQPLTD